MTFYSDLWLVVKTGQLVHTGDLFISRAVFPVVWQIEVSLTGGRIITGSVDNLVKTIVRQCGDQALTKCSDRDPHAISRKIEIALEK